MEHPLTSTVTATTGLTGTSAQILTWCFTLIIGYILIQVLQGIVAPMLKTKRKRGDLLLILGQTGAGKTALFFQLKDSEMPKTVSSLKPLRSRVDVPGDEGGAAASVEAVDFPGHLRLRNRLQELLPQARCIVYVVDSEDKQKLKDVAEHLYELFTNNDINALRTPIILACNKSDSTTARTEKFIIDEIEREIERMRISRGATLEGQDQADSFLGIEGEKFKLMEHSPCHIESCSISVKKPALDPLYSFLRQQFA